MNEEAISINLYDIGESNSPDIKDMEMSLQDAYSTTLPLDSGDEDRSTDETKKRQ
jgi:hypothetical protein